jgi:hypothetical protein
MWRAMLVGIICITVAAGSTAASQELIGFDTYPDGTPVPTGWVILDQWKDLGVVFTNADSVSPAGIWSSECSYSAPNHAFGDPAILAWFVDPTNGTPSATDFAGTRQDWCWVPGEGIMMEAYDIQGQLIAEEFNDAPGKLVTFSFPTPTIAMLKMTCVGQGIDDFVFNTVPTGIGRSGARAFELGQNHPNPFNPSTTISFTLPERARVTLLIYDVQGRLLRTLVDDMVGEGYQERMWDGKDASGSQVGSGVYFYRLTAGDKTLTKKMVLLK